MLIQPAGPFSYCINVAINNQRKGHMAICHFFRTAASSKLQGMKKATTSLGEKLISMNFLLSLIKCGFNDDMSLH
jgi:hypothetical protein